MVFLSHGQRESSHSGDSSSSDSDPEEQRFYARVNRSQRQQSSSTSSSSSDSEHEEVSNRPAAEKPAAPPSPKKSPNSLDMSAVRKQRTPSEPNPYTPSSSKPKKAAAAKRAKDDASAEEQPEPKKKSAPKGRKPAEEEVVNNDNLNEGQPEPKNKLASKGKKPAEEKVAKDDDFGGELHEPKKKSVSRSKKAAVEEVVKDDEAAEDQTELKKKSVSKGKKPAEEEVPTPNPTNKKPRKQLGESPAPVLMVSSTKDSPQKSSKTSSKKTAHVWTDNDESVIMHGYLVCAKEGLELPKNLPQLLEKINDSLAHEASKPQLYEKLRRMKARYESIKNKMTQGNIKEDVFAYKTPHEKKLYKLWKQAWGERHEEDEIEVEPPGDGMEVNLTEAVGDDTQRPGEDQITAGDCGEEDKEEAEEDGPDGGGTTPRPGEDQITAGDRGEEDEEEVAEDETDGGTDTDKERKNPNTAKASVSNHIPSKAPVSNHIAAKDTVSNHIPVKPSVSSTAIQNNKPEDRVDYETIMKETSDMLAEVTRDVKKMAETSEAKLKALLDSHLSSANGFRDTGVASGRIINSAVWLRNRDHGLDGIYYLRELPPLDGARAQILEGKRREVKILETQASLKRYALLHEECTAHLESMMTSGGNSRS